MNRVKCICDNCGMTFDIKMLQSEPSILHGEKVTVLSFTCPKCNKKFIVSVLDHSTAVLRKSWLAAQRKYLDLIRHSKDPSADQLRLARHDMEFYKKQTLIHMEKLKKAYMRELRKYGKA